MPQRALPEIAKDLRQQIENLKGELEAISVCVSRECMCDTAAPVVKLEALIYELECFETPYIPEPEHHRMGL